MIFEACGDGVDITSWTDFMYYDWHLLYDKIYYRKLLYDIPPKAKRSVENFVASAIGKKYSLAPSKFFRKKSLYHEKVEDDQTFFCSELVAASYKRLGLIQKDVPSSSFFPADFSMSTKLELLKGARLRHEQVVNFML